MRFHDIAQIITMQCIGKCNYCMYGTKLNLTPDVPLEDLLNYYRQIPEEDTVNIKITGGEPLQPNNVERTLTFIKEIKKMPFVFTGYQINTNGNWGIPQYILDDDISRIQISCDGPREYQNKNYGHDYFDKLLATLEQVRNNPKAYIMMVITPETEQYYDYVRELANSYGLGHHAQFAAPVDKASHFDMKENRIIHCQEFYDAHQPYFGPPMDVDWNKIPIGPNGQPIIDTQGLSSYNYDNHIRDLNFLCGHRELMPTSDGSEPSHDEYGIGYGITADGRIVNCPILSEKISGATIYNTSPLDFKRINKMLDESVKDATCIFPNGVQNYIDNLPPDEAEQVNKLRNRQLNMYTGGEMYMGGIMPNDNVDNINTNN